MELSAGFLLLAGFAVTFAGVSKGGFGSGVSFAAAPMLALILDPVAALSLLLPLLLVMDIAALPPYWRAWHGPSVRLMLLGALPGVVLAIAVWRVADADLFRLLIGGIALGYLGFELARARGWLRLGTRQLSDEVGVAMGALAAFASFVSHAGGPAAAVYLLSRGITKTEYQATTVLVFGVVNVLKLAGYTWLGALTPEMWRWALLLLPAALGGVALGVLLHRRMSGRLFFALTYVFLAFAGCRLIYDALV